MIKLPIYMDYQASTPVDPRVVEAMTPYFTEIFANAASKGHVFGIKAAEAADSARRKIAEVIGADPREIIFTSGATESDNTAIFGIAEMYRSKGDHIITVATEHKAVLIPFKALQHKGFNVTVLSVDKYGRLDPEVLKKAITDKTILVSVMAANNEIGTIHPIREIGKITREKGVIFHCDAAQAVGRIPIDVNEMNIDLMSISAHKIYGPKGVGALYVRRSNPRVRLTPLIQGGGHEMGLRSGTTNVPGVVGFAKALEIAAKEMENETKRLKFLTDRLHRSITSRLDEVRLNGHPTERLPNNLNLSFAYVEGESLMLGMPEVAVSSGSACTSATLEPSHVLKAIGVDETLAHSSIRFSIGRWTTEEEVDYVAGKVVEVVEKLRKMSPLYDMAKSGVDLTKVKWTGGHVH